MIILPSDYIKKGWCRGEFCLDKDGKKCSILSASYHSIPAAVLLAFWDDSNSRKIWYERLEQEAKTLGFFNLTEMNDRAEKIVIDDMLRRIEKELTTL